MEGPVDVTTRRKSILAAVRAELEAQGQVATPAGATALALAERLDGGAGTDPGSAVAAMSKELRMLMAELSKSPVAAGDPVDELKKRRQARRSG